MVQGAASQSVAQLTARCAIAMCWPGEQQFHTSQHLSPVHRTTWAVKEGLGQAECLEQNSGPREVSHSSLSSFCHQLEQPWAAHMPGWISELHPCVASRKSGVTALRRRGFLGGRQCFPCGKECQAEQHVSPLCCGAELSLRRRASHPRLNPTVQPRSECSVMFPALNGGAG